MDALLLSGGLDSSIIASVARPAYAVTIALRLTAPDIQYARQIGRRYCGRHIIRVLDENEVLLFAEQVIKTLKTFDPMAIRNSVVALAGLEQAKSDSYSLIISGDGCDELFAGYNFLSRYYGDFQRLNAELGRLWEIMYFPSYNLARAISVQLKSPYLDPEFALYAKSIPVEKKVGIHDGKQWGKFILRSCFEKKLGHISWREKAAQELGAGIHKMHEFFTNSIDDSALQLITKNAQLEGVALRDKEHAYYYSVFRKYHSPPREDYFPIRCPFCGGGFTSSERRFCRVCGAYPVVPVKSL